jgi:hypothetical protein
MSLSSSSLKAIRLQEQSLHIKRPNPLLHLKWVHPRIRRADVLNTGQNRQTMAQDIDTTTPSRPYKQAVTASFQILPNPQFKITFLIRRPPFSLTLWLIKHCYPFPYFYFLSTVGIATGYELDVRSSIPGRDKWFLFSLLHSVQIGSGAQPAYRMDTGGGLYVRV